MSNDNAGPTTKVVSLFGDPVPALKKPNDSVIDLVRDLLAQAEAGELQGLGIVMLMHDEDVRVKYAGLYGGFSQIGASYALAHHYEAQNLEDTPG